MSLSLSPSFSLPLSPYPHLSLSSLIPQILNEDILKLHSNIKEGAHSFFWEILTEHEMPWQITMLLYFTYLKF